ncbi:NAD(+) diphosphatase [Aurantimonas sp. C2-6-R+9]|uniref:NAD(+) diphosphatase n=1 Tax=unclassified Aurantimonas TaxID=2638230 RepID=UPI002E197001|nr:MULTISPECIES: NAD(+) diphosphatase [unclassified Aurantimonas]MEC5292048.1 NAD(+) diphosphatase [Aurantimonas sp. C2-3-R2]MEC5382198.1 NAD(+) diphosphatase [Aurantimonas sp. C2-6-R+9]MEC5413134.1 NAD(+) diphosphatase [Aurantimonas sp. C2-4-R8]
MKDDSAQAAAQELSGLTGFAGNRLWRDGERRNGDSLAAALEHTDARIFLTHDGQWLCRTTDASAPDPSFAKSEAVERGANLDDCVLLGFDPAGRPSLAAAIDETPALTDDLALIGLRSIAMQAFLDPDTEGQLGQAAHLLGWHAKNRFCARCGKPTATEAAGYRRRCTGCGDVVFPRTDPVTIMLVHDGEGRCVLGRQPHFPENFWSCLAGFVEAGETVEAAVRRETLEESGLTVGCVRYLASQPWPFPGSLMIGCVAQATSRDIDFDAEELEACRWFARDEVQAMLEGRHFNAFAVPQRFAIAHHLIKAFADDVL